MEFPADNSSSVPKCYALLREVFLFFAFFCATFDLLYSSCLCVAFLHSAFCLDAFLRVASLRDAFLRDAFLRVAFLRVAF